MEIAKVIEKIQRYCARSEHCESEIRKKLLTYEPELKETDIEDILLHLQKFNYWDERRYAMAYVHDKHEFNYWGPMKISYALKGKEVPDTIIYEAMKQVNEEEYLDTLHYLLHKKYSLDTYENTLEARKKLSRYAQNKGYTYELINSVLGKILPK